MSIKLHNGWMGGNDKCDLIVTTNNTCLSFGEVSLITMAIMNTKTQDKLKQTLRLLYHKILNKI